MQKSGEVGGGDCVSVSKEISIRLNLFVFGLMQKDRRTNGHGDSIIHEFPDPQQWP